MIDDVNFVSMFGFGFFGLNVVTKSPKLMYCFFSFVYRFDGKHLNFSFFFF